MKKYISWMLTIVNLFTFVPATLTTSGIKNDDSFTIIWLSDTQDMAYHGYDHALQKMGTWIIDRKEDLNIRYIVQTGDAVDNGAAPKQWAEFDEMYMQFRGKIPYISAAGNHEVKKNGYLEYCMRPDIRTIPRAFAFERGKASYCTFEMNSCKLIIVAIGSGIEEDSVDWVNQVLQTHKDHSAILLYHDYMQTNGRFSVNGKSMFKQVVLPNPNVRMVLCGHVHGVSSRIDAIDDNNDGSLDRTVAQLMYNYQHYKDKCGQLRTMQFNTEDHSITITTYSPVTDRLYRDWMFGDQFSFKLDNAF